MKTKTVLGKILTIERIERSDFDRGVDDHEITPIPHVNDMAECDEDDADATLLN